MQLPWDPVALHSYIKGTGSVPEKQSTVISILYNGASKMVCK